MHKKLITYLAVLLLLTTGCLNNPSTGKMGPSWQVPLSIPLISKNITADDLLDRVNFTADKSETDGYHKQFTFEEDLHFKDVESLSFSPVEIDVEDSVVVPGDMSFSFSSKLDFADLWQDGVLEELSFIGGSLKIDLNENSGATIEKISFAGKEYDGNSIPLVGLTLKDQDELEISGTITKGATIKNITVTLNAKANDIASIKGNNLGFNLPRQNVDLEFDFPEELEDISFYNVGLTLSVEYKNETGNAPTFDLSGLEIGELSIDEIKDNVITFKSEDATKLLNNPPDAIEIGGKIKTLDSSIINFSDSLGLKFEVIVPLQFELSQDIVYESDARSINVSQASLDGLNDLANSFYGQLDLQYRMPAEIKIDLYLSNKEKPLDDEKAVQIRLTVEAAPTNEEGLTTGVKEQLIPVELPEETRDLLKKQTYAQIKITIPAEKHSKIALSVQDFVKVMAWVELTVNVNK